MSRDSDLQTSFTEFGIHVPTKTLKEVRKLLHVLWIESYSDGGKPGIHKRLEVTTESAYFSSVYGSIQAKLKRTRVSEASLNFASPDLEELQK